MKVCSLALSVQRTTSRVTISKFLEFIGLDSLSILMQSAQFYSKNIKPYTQTDPSHDSLHLL